MKAAKLIGLVCITGLLGMGIARAEDKAHGKKDPHQGHGHSHDHDHNHDHDHDKSEPSKKSKNNLSEQERRVIRIYVEGLNGRGGGNRGGKGLPPGWPRKLSGGSNCRLAGKRNVFLAKSCRWKFLKSAIRCLLNWW